MRRSDRKASARRSRGSDARSSVGEPQFPQDLAPFRELRNPPAGCPGVSGPAPQPVSMMLGVYVGSVGGSTGHRLVTA